MEMSRLGLPALDSNTWVLVVHNYFKNIPYLERIGNEIDIINIKQLFCATRGCKFAEMENCGREEIIGALSQEEKLTGLFKTNGIILFIIF